MTTKRKWIVWSVLAVLVVGVGFVGWGIATVPRVLRDLYGQWVTAELVINYHKDHLRLPKNWQELETVYGDGKGLHHGGMTFPQIRECMVVDFGRLAELQALAGSTSSVVTLPEIIHTKSGTESHWAGAEPNQMVYGYLQGSIQKRGGG